jgi:hypothetical protein
MDKILYMEKLEGINYDSLYKNNLQSLMEMGFLNFDLNLQTLKKF